MSNDWILASLEEYKKLRQESLAAIEQMQRTYQIGLVAIGVLTAFGVDVATDRAGVQVGLAISAPLVAAIVVALRLDELHRAVKAGAHVAVLEHRIARKIGRGEPPSSSSSDQDDAPLTWESKVQEEFVASNDKRRHWAIAAVLVAAAAPSILLGTSRLEGWLTVLVAAGVVLIFGYAARYQFKRLDEVAGLHAVACTEIEKISRESA
jgi:hypothetical protein